MHKNPNPVTHLCWSDADRIVIRGKDLCNELIGHMTFTEMTLFHMLKQPPTAMQTTIVDAVLVTIMEHGLTPSAISARQTFFGAPEALQGAVAAGILGVGSRFAGTSGDCAILLREIVEADEGEREGVASAIAKRFREARKPLPGYGHPIHKNGDPRVTRLEQIAMDAGATGNYIKAMYMLGEAINNELRKKLIINASAGMGAVLAEAGLPPEIMRGIILISRAAGVVGHLLEEMEEPAANYMWETIEESIPYVGTK